MRRILLPFSSALLMVSSAATAQSVSTITTTTVSNGTTLPFQRHIIRVGPAATGQGELVAAIQRQGAGGEGLDLFLSQDDGQSWVESLPVQDDSTERDTADLLADPDGNGFSLLYSLEPPSSGFAVDPRSDVVFLHYSVAGDLSISVDTGPITVYAPGKNQAYFRCSIARDSTDTLHATATLLDATNGNEFSWWESVSTDNGNSWTSPVLIETFGATEGGGRVNAYGDRLIAVYDDYSVADEGRYRTKAAGASSTWGSEGIVEPLGLYHAGAFSVTATPDGHVHLGYSDKPEEQLWYREFDGSSWSAATRIESSGVWSNQPALSSFGNTLFYSWNHMVTATDNVIEQITKPQGGTFSSPTVVDDVPLFKGYTNALEVVSPGEALAVLWSQDPTPSETVSNVQCGLVSGLSGAATSGGGGGSGTGGGGGADAGPPSDAGSGVTDAGSGVTDAGSGVTDAGSGAPDAGPPSGVGAAPDAGTQSGGSGGGNGGGGTAAISVTVDYTNDAYAFRAVDSAGTAYATNLAEQSSRLYASTDNARTWSYRGTTPDNSDFKEMAALSSGTLLADTQDSAGNFTIARSTDHGATWTLVLPLLDYRLLSTRSVAELGGTVYLLEYQVFSNGNEPIDLYASQDDGQTWSVLYTFQGHRHGHCIRVDPSGGLWAFFGDSDAQAGIYRSTDQGHTWNEVLSGPTALGDDAVFLSNGDALYGQDISNLPDLPYVVTLTPGGRLTDLERIPGPAYSIQLTPAGGYLMGETWEPNDTVYAAGDTSAHLLGSVDGVNWVVLGAYPTSDTTNYGRADVYWSLASGEVVLSMSNVTTLSSTTGYELLQVTVTGGGSGGSGNGGSGTTDGGTGSADAGSTGGGGSGSADAGSGGGSGTGSSVSFSDTFAGCTSTTSLDSSWTTTGTWYCAGGRARGESAGGIALALTATLGNADVSSLVQLDGSSGSGVIARASGDSGYAAIIDVSAGIDIVSLTNGVATVLASTNASILDETSYTLGLTVTGTNPVTLQALLNGTVVATATDSSSGAFAAGAVGLLSGANARTQYANFTVTGTTGSSTTLPPPPAGLPYSDTFASCTATSGLGNGWTADGTWYCDAGYARGESAGGLALAQLSLPESVTASARVQLTGVATGSGVVVRATASDFYRAIILATGSVEIDRVDSGSVTRLASVSTTILSGAFYDVDLTVSGTGPVQLSASINGARVVSATDSGASLASGSAGLYSGTVARTQFNDFEITSP